MKIRTALLPLVLSLCLLAGCGASTSGTAANQNGVSLETGAAAEVSDVAGEMGGTLETDALSQQQTDQKIIYTAWLELESRQFDQARTQLVQALDQAGGYIESSSENGSASGSARWVSLVLRVPADQYQDFLSQAGQTGNLISLRQEQENVTAEYVDIEARLNSLETQRTRLQELLAQAQQLEDLLQIQQQLSDTEYQIESYTAQMRALQNQIAYCTVTVDLREVENLTLTQPSFGQRIGEAFRDGWVNFGRQLQELAVALVYGMPGILLLVIVAVPVVILLRRAARKKGPAAPRTPADYSAGPAYTRRPDQTPPPAQGQEPPRQ